MRFFKQQIDRWAIRAAARSLPCRVPDPRQAPEVKALLSSPDLFVPPETAPSVSLDKELGYRFESSVLTPCRRNNLVQGRIFPARGDWRRKPSVLLIHGWNAELHYTNVLPTVARALASCGMNGVLIELPYHLHRRPTPEEGLSNFISEDIPRMIEAASQSVADINAVLHWLRREGSPATAIWGFSLGGWLAGLHLCRSAAQDAAVLTTPVSDLGRAVTELEFCHPIRRALEVVPVNLEPLNLGTRAPAIPPGKVLLMQAKYDQFVPNETYEQLAATWGLAGWESVPQSHISILVSRPAMRQTIEWLETKLVPGAGS